MAGTRKDGRRTVAGCVPRAASVINARGAAVRRRKDVVEPVEDDSLLAQCRMVEFHLRGGAVRGVDARGRRAEDAS